MCHFDNGVYPACAGIHLSQAPTPATIAGLPRMRGDPPPEPGEPRTGGTSTPHARGSTAKKALSEYDVWVYPACAGIHPPAVQRHVLCGSLPRMRGDPPQSWYNGGAGARSTPHARGSTPSSTPHRRRDNVYPACAGIHRKETTMSDKGGSLPRMRGDPPPVSRATLCLVPSTPHARGSTRTIEQLKKGLTVYPACAGIHRLDRERELTRYRLPRMRGDPPVSLFFAVAELQSTPHARGSTLT